MAVIARLLGVTYHSVRTIITAHLMICYLVICFIISLILLFLSVIQVLSHGLLDTAKAWH